MTVRILLSTTLCLCLASLALTAGASTSLVKYVDPMVGTANGGNIYPGAVVPFGMVQFSPDTGGNANGYDYGDRSVQGFSLTHMSGTGCRGYGDVFLTPTTGAVDVSNYQSPFDHSRESASPGYYRVVLDRWHVNAELTAADHAGMARFSFPSGVPANVLIPISHTLTTSHAAQVDIVDDRTVEGHVSSGSFCGDLTEIHTVYFVMRFSHPFQQFGTFKNGTIQPSSRAETQTDTQTSIGAYITFAPNSGPPFPGGERGKGRGVATSRTIEASIGISFVDLAGARRNLDHDLAGRGFDDVRRAASAKWETELHRIELEAWPNQHDELVKFYTALYHSLLMPNVWSDIDGRYIGFDNKIHQMPAGHAFYANYSGWDIYRTEAILLALVEPARFTDMCQSISLMARQLGWIDRWPTGNHPTEEMNGDPLSSVVATAWAMGLHGFDVDAAYKAMARDQQPRDDIDRYGYLPGDVSTTQEYCYAFAAVSQLAHQLGKEQDAAAFQRRALDYRNLFNPADGFMEPRGKNRNWPVFTPTQSDGFREGSGWQYVWYEPQDVRGIVTLLGGDEKFNAKLDSFFAELTRSFDPRYYNAYNEPDLQAPFLYYWSGAPWKTQAVVHALQEDVYGTTPAGIPGNDDCGEMSAWFVLTALGLYPTDPARPTLEILTPMFDKAVVHLSAPYTGKVIDIRRHGSPNAAYIASVSLDGWPSTRNWVATSVLTAGASIDTTVAERPDKAWGAAMSARPPSLSDGRPLLTPCTISPEKGTVGDQVTITSPDPNVKIAYTLDGSDPTPSSTLYTGPFIVDNCATVTAYAFEPGHTDSPKSVAFFGRPLPPAEGTGLNATYFSNRDLTGDTVQRLDPTIDFGWKDNKPDDKIGPENFSARWWGELAAPYTADYTISTISDDGIRVWFGDKLIIDDWTDHSPTLDSARVHMEANNMYPIKIEYYNHTDGDECRLEWSSDCIVEQIIPKDYLYAASQ